MTGFVLILILIIVSACNDAGDIISPGNVGVIEEYEPKDSITFPHEIHSLNNIDCKYCHHPITESNKNELTMNICKNCHKK